MKQLWTAIGIWFAGFGLASLISTLFSLAWGTGVQVAPAMLERTGLDATVAFLVQGILGGFLMLLWHVIGWFYQRVDSANTLARATGLHITCGALATGITGYICGWIASISGLVGFLLVFVAVYALIWVATYLQIRRDTALINQALATR